MSATRRGRRGVFAPVAIAAVVVGALAAFGLSVFGASRPQAARPTAPPSQPATPSRSPAVHLRIPAIGVDGALQRLGLNEDRTTMQLPAPGRAGWFTRGAAPGDRGPTIIVGYITSRHGPGIFSRLGKLKVGAHVDVRRADGKDIVYGIDKIRAYSATTFPAATVYARTPQPTLRLITCGGVLRPGAPVGNVVVYGHQLT